MDFLRVEIVCTAILAIYYGVTARLAHARSGARGVTTFAAEAVAIAFAAAVGEDTCVRFYGFYDYASGWDGKLDRVPFLVPLIWPPVILSARTIGKKLVAPFGIDPPRVALAAFAIVLFDASLIEPVAVHAGLWSWTEPGLFHVPWIGILGWGIFALVTTYLLETRTADLGLAPVALPLVTHALLLAAWWGGLRWIGRHEVQPFPFPFVVIAAAALAYLACIRRANATLAHGDLLARAAATSFFVWLLAAQVDGPLVAYAAAFAPPYLYLTARSLFPVNASSHASPGGR